MMQASETSKPGRFASIVVDTDVWLDYYLGFREGNRDACELLAAANRAGVNLLCADTTIKDLFYLTAADFKRDRRSRHGGQLSEEGVAASHATAWACLKNLKNHGPYRDGRGAAFLGARQAARASPLGRSLLRHLWRIGSILCA